ncbi:hypothetical protein DERF_008154 [Dermatophagoides farinae]|uniref:Uncharacterized protein n=1 Tax=Dermatophagoides farinae TaxID=6954 RepID=A0A922L4F8_DERFA|nr:hypothetical protein DERF_008154 [Dermatophagoides farinae]
MNHFDWLAKYFKKKYLITNRSIIEHNKKIRQIIGEYHRNLKILKSTKFDISKFENPNITVAYSWRPLPSSKSGGLKTNLVHMDGNLKILKIQRGRMYDEPKMKKSPINNNKIDTEQQSKFIHQQCTLAIYQSQFCSQSLRIRNSLWGSVSIPAITDSYTAKLDIIVRYTTNIRNAEEKPIKSSTDTVELLKPINSIINMPRHHY